MIVERGIIGFWTALFAGILILLHIPSCDFHWASRFKLLSRALFQYHRLTLNLATIFAIIHVVLAIIGLLFEVWI